MNTVCSCTYHLVLFYTFITSLAVLCRRCYRRMNWRKKRSGKREKKKKNETKIQNDRTSLWILHTVRLIIMRFLLCENDTHRRMMMACVCSWKVWRYERYEWCTFCCRLKLFAHKLFAWLCFALFTSELSLVCFVFSVEMHVIKQQTLKCYWILLSERSCYAANEIPLRICNLYFESLWMNWAHRLVHCKMRIM